MLHFEIWLISFLFYFLMNWFVRVKLAMTDHTLTVCDFSCRFLTKRWQTTWQWYVYFIWTCIFVGGFIWNNEKFMRFFFFHMKSVCVWMTVMKQSVNIVWFACRCFQQIDTNYMMTVCQCLFLAIYLCWVSYEILTNFFVFIFSFVWNAFCGFT